MRIETLGIADVKLPHLRQFGDERGFLSETYNRRRLLEAGIDLIPVQQNHSFSPRAGTLRGLHFQVPHRLRANLCVCRTERHSTWLAASAVALQVSVVMWQPS